MWHQLLVEIQEENVKSLARAISMVENETSGYEEFMESLPPNEYAKIIGITGPPGAGKSTLTDALIGELIKDKNKVGVLCVDPSSPFTFGSLLGDRVRMSEWYNHPDVFIRSLATRGSLGGLHPKIFEISDVMKAAGFDYIIIETVGVGQSEVEIAGLADVTIVVLVPEGGDVIQTMKAGVMEIADIFVVNKSDRPDADIFVNNLKMMLAPVFKNYDDLPIVKTVASEKNGVEELYSAIIKKLTEVNSSDKTYYLLAEKAFFLIQQKRMSNVKKHELFKKLKKDNVRNLYSFLREYF